MVAHIRKLVAPNRRKFPAESSTCTLFRLLLAEIFPIAVVLDAHVMPRRTFH